MDEKKIGLMLTEQELNIVFSKLVAAPFQEVASVISSIQQQLSQRQQPQGDVPA